MTAIDDESFPADGMRERQEREIAFTHQLCEVERALADEACVLSRVFEEAGVDFDPLTVVALRVVNECLDTEVEPVDVLADLQRRGVLLRAVALANEIRDSGDVT
jgi:hypothetical protein